MLNAELVDGGVGLPPVWRDPARGILDGPLEGWRETVLDLADPLNRSGLLRQLALWTGDDGDGQAYWMSWDGHYNLRRASGVGGRGKIVRGFFPVAKPMDDWDTDAVAALETVVKMIGMDHAVRRKLGWTVTGSNWATLRKEPTVDFWVIQDEEGNAQAYDGVTSPALADVTDVSEALRAIYEEVCNVDI
jgi:hypothetical protein